ncbi:MAG: hypothetical protein IIA41_13640, partial [SAR324 cluster bacterium]|nr:hypothetical protein [SAR324 cluster bacterium]
MTASDKRKALRARLEAGGLVVAPGVFDGISARIADARGFDALYMTGYGISASYLGENIGAVESYKRALPKMFRLLGASFMVGLIVFLGLICLVVPGIIFFLWYMLVSVVVMLESGSATDSLKRSKELVKDNIGKG